VSWIETANQFLFYDFFIHRPLSLLVLHYGGDFFMTAVQTGELLDHYRIEGIAARSGMASIFRGTDLRTGSPVAIKVREFPVSMRDGGGPALLS